ncbi:MAG: hypothetical protein ACK4NR_11415 [Micavibrio sp.]
MKNRDLQSIIEDMALRLDSIRPDDDGFAMGMLNEVEAYMAVDSTLASLHKEFIDSRRNRLRALEQQGEGSAMADIARDMEDSAKSAMETRILELRQDNMKRMMVERMMAQSHLEEMEEQRQASSKLYARRMAEYHVEERRDKMVQARRIKESEDSFLMMLLMWWMMRHIVWRTQAKLSLASSFSKALEAAFDTNPRRYANGTA